MRHLEGVLVDGFRCVDPSTIPPPSGNMPDPNNGFDLQTPDERKGAFVEYLKLVRNLCDVYKDTIICDKFIKLCSESADAEYIYYCEYYFGLLASMIQTSRLLLSGKLRYAHDEYLHNLHKHPTKVGSYETTYHGSPSESSLPLTTLCAEFFESQLGSFKVFCFVHFLIFAV